MNDTNSTLETLTLSSLQLKQLVRLHTKLLRQLASDDTLTEEQQRLCTHYAHLLTLSD